MVFNWVAGLVFVLICSSTGEAFEVTKVAAAKENNAPVAHAGQDETVISGTRVVLNGSASSDADGDSLSYQWTQTGGEPVELKYAKSPTPSFFAPSGIEKNTRLEFSLVVTENRAKKAKLSSPAKVTITILPTTAPPNCELASPSVETLSPPDHTMRRVRILNVVDDVNDPYSIVTLDVTKVTQDEPVNSDGKEDGNTAPDAVIHVADPFDTVSLRAERSDKGDGRVYIIYFKASDGFESCKGSVSVEVPKKQGFRSVRGNMKIDATRP